MYSGTALLLGATGLIGSLLLELLLKDAAYNKVVVLSRKPLSFSHPKMEVRITDFDNIDNYKNNITPGDVIFCCIGTTMKNVKGDKVLYRKIDFDIPVNAATIGKEKGYSRYVLVSAIGADKNASNFYLQLKGSVEEAISQAGYESVHIFQPSLLLGDRKEKRFAEKLAQWIMPAISFLFPEKYKAVYGADVAKAMLIASKKIERGITKYTYRQITTYSTQ